MERKTELMIALGVAMGANCIPCFDHLYSKAKEIELEDSDIKEIAVLAQKVKNGAATFLQQAIDQTMGENNTPLSSCACSTIGDCC